MLIQFKSLCNFIQVSKLQKELDHSREKLSSSMNSIKTFWSPELKKERAVRKEEAARCNLLNEQLKVAEAELRVSSFSLLNQKPSPKCSHSD